jgi:phage/plasmid primase-like uncharacterized protein
MEQIQFKKTLEALKSKVTLRRVIESYGISVKNPNRFIKCPFHSGDNTPSLKLYNADSYDGSFHCFGCNAGSDLLSFAEKYENTTATEALERLCKRFNISIETREYQNQLVESLEGILNPRESKKDNKDYFKQAFEAKKEFESLTEQNITKYMMDKAINHYGTKTKGRLLVVPVTDQYGNICNLQYIAPDGKKFYKGGELKNKMFKLGDSLKAPILLTEGYATGATVHQVTGNTVYVCFKSGNLSGVYEILSEIFPSIRIVLCGDNDWVGRNHSLPGIYPPDKDFDWNDSYVKYGFERTQKQILEGLDGKA